MKKIEETSMNNAINAKATAAAETEHSWVNLKTGIFQHKQSFILNTQISIGFCAMMHVYFNCIAIA